MENLDDIEKLASEFDSNLETFAAKKTKKKPKKEKQSNRGDVCFPANSKHNKSPKDRFPINNINQARNALSRAGAYDKAPPWFNGSLEQLKNTIRRKVHSKYPSIEVSKDNKKSKKSYVESILAKYS
jgi:hypothetical protein